MPDLLSHALLAYTICTLLAMRYDWLTPRYVTVGMAGAFVPDVAKVHLVLDGATVAAALDVPFDWLAIHTLGGSAVGVAIGTLLVDPAERRRVLGLLSLGAASHLGADALLVKASGRSYEVLWPLARYHPPTPGLYHSTNLWPGAVLGGVALVTWLLVRRSNRAVGE